MKEVYDHVYSTHSANYDKNYKLCFARNKLDYLNSLCSMYSLRQDKTIFNLGSYTNWYIDFFPNNLKLQSSMQSYKYAKNKT